MLEDQVTRSVRPVEQATFTSILPLLQQVAQVEFISFANMPSPHITLDHMFQLRQLVQEQLNRSDVDGVVVTHGTDTLEETAFFLHLTVASSKPVVVTGAMRSTNEIGADGPINLYRSVQVASAAASEGKGVLVVFNDEIHSAQYVTKTHTSNIATFQSPEFGPIGTVTKGGIHYLHAPLQRETYTIEQIHGDVPLIKAVAGMRWEWYQSLLTQPINGLVIEALGQGNLPPSILPLITQLVKKNIPIVMVSRCFNGHVEPVYDYIGGGRQLQNLGLIFSNGLNGPKARIKLLILLQQIQNFSQLQKLFSLE